MADLIRIKSMMPLALRISEPHPDPERPGASPELKQAILRPGVNDGVDGDLFKAWADAHAEFVATPDDVKAGATEGKIYVMPDDEPDTEFGFELALKRASEGDNAKAAAAGSTLTARPVTAEDQRPGSATAASAPVLAGAGGAPIKTPTTDANLAMGKPVDRPAADVKK